MDRRQIGCLIGVLILIAWVSVTLAGTVSEEAQRYMNRGLAAVEMAKTPADYEGAIREFEKAKSLAPYWADVYYNLGLIQEKAGKYGDAVTNLKQYLRLAPNASDAAAVKSLITKLEYKKEKTEGSRYIDILNAKVTEVKFYEGGFNSPAKDKRLYRTSFPRTGTRYIYFELNLEHPMPGQRKEFMVESVWFNPYGAEIFRHNLNSYIQDNWVSTYHADGCGWRDAASSGWIQGVYRVDLYVNGIKIASGNFNVY